MSDEGGNNEFAFIERLRERTRRATHSPRAHSPLTTHHSPLTIHHSSPFVGIGDDAAVLAPRRGTQTVITADLLVENIDFRRRWLSLKQLARCLGRKALAVSLSDIAAMGARPRYCLTSIGLPPDVWRSGFADEFYDGLLALAAAHGVALVGGDTSRTPEHIVIDSIVLGEVRASRGVLRSGAQAGDRIFVTGRLGGAAAGLRLLEAAKGKTSFDLRAAHDTARGELLRRQLAPTPRLAWGALLGEGRLASAMIDISDGLAADLRHICDASEVGAVVDAARVPVDDGADLRLALSGGEDYELLFTVQPAKLKRLPPELDGVHATEIGVIHDAKSGIALRTDKGVRRLTANGFAHFVRNR